MMKLLLVLCLLTVTIFVGEGATINDDAGMSLDTEVVTSGYDADEGLWKHEAHLIMVEPIARDDLLALLQRAHDHAARAKSKNDDCETTESPECETTEGPGCEGESDSDEAEVVEVAPVITVENPPATKEVDQVVTEIAAENLPASEVVESVPVIAVDDPAPAKAVVEVASESVVDNPATTQEAAV